MSPIKDLEPRPTEIGRIRAGTVHERKSSGGKITKIPVKLEHWRLTSAHMDAIAAAAKIYGGELGEWSEGHGTQYELLTESDTLHVLIPPQDPSRSQYLELWAGGGVRRRCDGVLELLSGSPCVCAAEGERICKPTTHLRVVLPELPGLGVWRVTTQSWAAAAEIPAALAMLDEIRGMGMMPAADLVLEQRESRGTGELHRYAVPTLILPYTLAEALEQTPTLPAEIPDYLALPTDEQAELELEGREQT